MIRPSTANFKQDHDKYVARAITMIHSAEVQKKILELLTGDNPVQRVAKATVMVMQRMDQAARDKGIEIQDTVKALAAAEILSVIAETGESAGKLKLDKDLKELALSTAVQDYINEEIRAGRINRQKLAIAIQRDMRQMPPKMRKEIMDTMSRVQMTARKYNNGMGAPMEQEAPKTTGKGGLINER